MLKNLPPILGPELLKVLCEMGHGDELVIADGNFPSASVNDRVIRLDGHGVPEILKAVLTVFPLDHAQQNTVLMAVSKGEDVQTPIWDTYDRLLKKGDPHTRQSTASRSTTVRERPMPSSPPARRPCTPTSF